MAEKAEEKRMKIQMKQLEVVDKNLDVAKIQAERRRREAASPRLTA